MKTVFLDRDGVINKDRPDYVKTWPEFEFLPGSLHALKLLNASGYNVVVITNQSVISQGLVTEAGVREIHEKMKAAVADHGGRIEAIYHCPHIPQDQCDCRKPAPGLINRALADYNIDLSAACMIGDNLKDIECARRSGCGRVILVRTGHGRETERLCRDIGTMPDHVADDLLAAVEWLIRENSKLKAQG